MLNLYISGSSTLGYSVHGLNMLKAFIENGTDTNITLIGQINIDQYYNKFLEAISSSVFDKNCPSLHIFHSNYSNQALGSPLVNFAVFETTQLQAMEFHHLQHTVDLIFTTTEDHKALIEENGITTPVHVIHEGADPKLYNTEPCTKYIDTGKFTYITAGKNELRKNTDTVIKAYIETSQLKDTALIAHTFDPFYQGKDLPWTNLKLENYGYKGVEENKKYLKFSNGVSDIYLTKYGIPVSSMKSLYRSANVGIFFSKAEGWNLGLMECMACGIPTIASNVIGHKEYLKDAPTVQKNLIIEPTGLEIADDGKWFKGDRGSWATLNKSDLYDLIEDVYESKEDYETPNNTLSTYYHNNFNWHIPAKKVRDILSV